MDEAPAHLSRFDARLIFGTWACATLPLALFLLEWGVAWITLGHIPRPMADDPKSISGLCSFLHALTTLSFFLAVPVGLLAVAACVVRAQTSRRMFAAAGIGLVMIAGSFAVLGQLPYDAMGWWID